MKNLGGERRGLSGTDLRPGDFPLGSVQSRAAARAHVEADPCFAIMYGGRDPNFVANFAALLEDNRRGLIYERHPDESQKQFQERMLYLPGRKRGGLVTHYYSNRPSFPG
jgi:hypothetical protein